MIHFWLTIIAFIVICSPCLATTESQALNDEGITLYRSKQYEKAVAKFEEALKCATPGSEDELAAANNLVFPVTALGNLDDQWMAEKRAHELEHHIRGTAIPDGYMVSTRQESLAIKLRNDQARAAIQKEQEKERSRKESLSRSAASRPYQRYRQQ